ncbi:hypothetical protein EAG11_07025 [Flavobacterium sp. 140616W15]|nr:hypothetical protein EAG11_07025 [Flavobacterium sp. 140616W15]
MVQKQIGYGTNNGVDTAADQRAIKNGFNYIKKIMITNIKKYSLINFSGSILICAFKIIQNLFLDGDNHLNRRMISSIGFFLIVPVFIICLITFIFVWAFYIEKRFKYNLSYFYLTIPFILILCGLLYFMISIYLL